MSCFQPISIRSADLTGWVLSVPAPGNPARWEAFVERLAEAEAQAGAAAVQVRLFGRGEALGKDLCAAFARARARHGTAPEPGAIRWVCSDHFNTAGLSGAQLLSLNARSAESPVRYLCFDRPMSLGGEHDFAFARLLRNAENDLSRLGLSWENVVRTWFYLPRIHTVYDAFNRVRTRAYGEAGLGPHGSTHPYPTSTGVGGALGEEGRIGLELLAHPKLECFALGNPMQLEAPGYGSSFSRAVCIGESAPRLVFISGTAAIGRGGETLAPGDPVRQLGHTLDAVGALLAQIDGGLEDIVGATAYFSSYESWERCAPLFPQQVRFPCAVAFNTLCRKDLLVELEAIAVCGDAAADESF